MGSAFFPDGLRALVVDGDTDGSKKLESKLIKCNYQVMICSSAQAALDLLQERKDGFDIVISDANVPDMFLEQVGVLDLPVVVMCGDGESGQVMRGVQLGACDYLMKPIKMNELRKIWLHVYRKRVQGDGGVGFIDSYEDLFVTGKNKKDHLDVDVDDNQILDSGSAPSLKNKKPRVVWDARLHDGFISAVKRVGGVEKAGPKKILDLMGEPGLTRENVASHLQKYRMHLKGEKKVNDLKGACGGMKITNFSSSENTYLESGVPPSSLTLQQNNIVNELHLHCPRARILSTFPMQAEAGNVMYGGIADAPINSSSRIAYNQQQQLQPCTFISESRIQAHSPWGVSRYPSPQFTQQHLKPHFQFDQFSNVFNSRSLRREEDHQPMGANTTHMNSKYRSYASGHENTATPAMHTIPQQSYLPHYNMAEPAPGSTRSTKSHNVEQQIHLPYNLEPGLKNMSLRSHEVEQNDCTPAPGDIFLQNLQLDNDTMPDLFDPQNFEEDHGSRNSQWNDDESE